MTFMLLFFLGIFFFKLLILILTTAPVYSLLYILFYTTNRGLQRLSGKHRETTNVASLIETQTRVCPPTSTETEHVRLSHPVLARKFSSLGSHTSPRESLSRLNNNRHHEIRRNRFPSLPRPRGSSVRRCTG